MTDLSDFWKGRRVLVTGHTGFKGAWLTLWLHRLGAIVTGIALRPLGSTSLFELARVENLCDSHICDVRDALKLEQLTNQVKPEVVFHLAAQSLVRASYVNPLETFDTNLMGTANLLNALRANESVRVAVMVTTDKVYRNLGVDHAFSENDEKGGFDPYSASKAASELIIESFRHSFFSDRDVAISSARAGNVIGGGDWAKDRLIPDAVQAWQANQPVRIRNPEAIRPWQHVLEPLFGYLQLAKLSWFDQNLAGAYNFGPASADARTVGSVIEMLNSAYGFGSVEFDITQQRLHEAQQLRLDTGKAHRLLGYRPRLALTRGVEMTANWYRRQARGADAQELCIRDIQCFESLS